MRITIDTATDGVKEAEHAIAIIGAYYELGDAKITLSGPTPEQMAANVARVLQQPCTDADRAAMAAVTSGAPVLSIVPQMPAPVAERSAAEVFAGNVPPLPEGAIPLPVAPSSAGAIPLPNAPVALPVSLAPSVTAAPAAPTAPLAPVLMVHATPQGTPATGPAGGAELDAEGIIWDARIHQSTKNKTAKGFWKVRKGLNDDALLARVKAELKALVGAGQAPAALTPPPAPFIAPAAPSAPALPGVPSGVRPDPATALELMPRYTPAVHAGLIPSDALQSACVAYGLANVPALSHKPEYVVPIWQYLKQQYPAFAGSNP